MPSKDFHLARTSRTIGVGSWAAVEPNGTELPSTFNPLFNPPRLGASIEAYKV
ncbi:MAG: hypothetical protein HA491_00985 [Candidatus Verstraetearchaeota archaeon]|nr:hypothetical protein [Candidatus Verstraetearchaeota archaeon]